MIDLSVIQDTEKRFSDRKSMRETTKRKIETKPLIKVDSPDRVEKRLARLGVNVEAAKAIAVGAAALESVDTTALPDIKAVGLERILGKSDLLGASYLETGTSTARSVGRIRIRNERGRVVGYGTGFKVSPRLLLTNNHVLRNAQEASFSQVEFNFQDGRDGRPLPSVVFDLDPQTFFVTSKPLDYSLVAIRDNGASGAPLDSFGFCRLIEAEGKIILGEYASIIQHPNGEPKQLALRENQVVDLLDDFIHYQTDTAPGSSGSAVFNDQWEVVALHHSGVPKRDQQKRILAVDGRVWTPDMGEDKVAWVANEGVRISKIIKDIKNRNLTTTQRQLRSQMFDESARPTVPAEAFDAPAGLATRAQPSAADLPTLFQRREVGTFGVPSPATGGEGTNMSWVIPITVSVRLGAGAQPPVITVRDREPQPPPVTDAAAHGGAVLPPPESADLGEALAELEEAKKKPYYDKEKDKKDRAAYYKGLPGSLSKAKLFERLSELVQDTHENQPKYQPAKRVYPWVDLQPNLKLRSVYSGIEFDPEEIIREDFRIDQERAARFQEKVTTESVFGAERMAEELDMLEALLPYNCEHVVCQSWFNKSEPMRGDLHHLFALESGCNSFRGNTPYFDFADFEEAVREDCGKRETDKFEPTAGKGAVARATFYFLMRYPGIINKIFDVYDEDRLKILLAWHNDNPVTEYELHRNQAIFAVQRNRNPFIDNPQWVKKVDLTEGL